MQPIDPFPIAAGIIRQHVPTLPLPKCMEIAHDVLPAIVEALQHNQNLQAPAPMPPPVEAPK